MEKSATGRILSLEPTEGKTKGREDKRKEYSNTATQGNDWETKLRLKKQSQDVKSTKSHIKNYPSK